MARLSKEKFQDTSRFKFEDEEVEFAGDTVLIRSPLTLEQRDEILNKIEGNLEANQVEVIARVFGVAVVEPNVSIDEARLILAKYPGPVIDEFIERVDVNALLGIKQEEEESAVADEFPGGDGTKVSPSPGGASEQDGPGTQPNASA